MIKFKQLDRNELIKRLKKLYDNKYDFSYSEYIGMDKPFKYLCNKHGWQQCIPLNLVRGHGCKECYLEERNNKNYELLPSYVLNGVEFTNTPERINAKDLWKKIQKQSILFMI